MEIGAWTEESAVRGHAPLVMSAFDDVNAGLKMRFSDAGVGRSGWAEELREETSEMRATSE